MTDPNIERALGRIEGKLDELRASIDRQDERLDNHSSRLRAVENRQHWFLGIGALSAALVAGAWDLMRGVLK